MIDVGLIFKRLAITAVILTLVAAGTGWWWVRSSVATLDGEWRLSGLRGPVEVVSDTYGAPHVYARDVEDAWFMAGALHARDRLWQMELYRRASQGRLSEILGEAALPIDQRMLTLAVRAAAEAEWARIGGAARTALTRYADGVNAEAATLTGRRKAPELQLLGLTPAPWTPQDSLAVGRLLAFRLAENQGAELVRHALDRQLGTAAANALTGQYPADGPTVLGELAPATPVPPAPTPAMSPAAATRRPSEPRFAAARPPVEYPPGLAWLDPTAPRANSNAWVVAGSRTATGRPLLANDPHLLIEMPSVWYEMHLVAGGLDVQGVSVPGTPFVAIGHTGRIAWGFTNTGADVQDFVIERLDLAGRRVFTGAGWEPVRVEDAPIPVRGRPSPAPFEVWRTGNGIVYADEGLDWESPPAWLTPGAARSGEQRALVLKWSGFDTGGYADAFEALNRAGNWTEFQFAVGQMSALSQNAMYADVDGHIGYVMTGQVPTRASGDGARPQTPENAVWTGVIGGAALPRVLDPDGGFLASSNNPVMRGDVPFVTRDWMAPFRASTIVGNLMVAQGVDVAAAAKLQLDTHSAAATAVLANLDAALAAAKDADAAAMGVLERLKRWDGVVDATEDTTLYELFENRLWRRVFADDLPDALFRRYFEWAGAERFAGLYSVLADPASPWWDDIGTIERKESMGEIYVLAAADAARDFESLGTGGRAWDRIHGASFAHALAPGGRLLAWFFNRGPVPVVGDGTTVMRISYRRLRGFGAWEHPSWRQVLDVGGWDNSRAVLPVGQSGHPLSPHYFDQNELWRSGRLRPLPFSRGAVDGVAAHRQIASP